MLVVRRRIEFLSHVEPPSQHNASAIRTFPQSDEGNVESRPAIAWPERQCMESSTAG
jgi:hypothetical protein